MTNPLPITTLYASLYALLLMALSYRVVHLRKKLGVGFGSGGKPQLEQAIRVQGNFSEYVPTFIVLLLLAELNQAPPWALHVAGAGVFVARLLHAWGLSRQRGSSRGRYFGTLFTWVILVALALANLASLWSLMSWPKPSARWTDSTRAGPSSRRSDARAPRTVVARAAPPGGRATSPAIR